MAGLRERAGRDGHLVRRAAIADAPALAGIHGRCFSSPWSDAGIRGHLRDEACLAFHVARRRGGALAGFVIARTAADEAEILTIAVLPELRGRGLGSSLLRHVLDCLPDHGAGRVFLEVAADNHAARALYEKLGFGDVGRRIGYYRRADAPAEDAICLARAVGDR